MDSPVLCTSSFENIGAIVYDNDEAYLSRMRGMSMLQLVGAIILIIAAKLAYDIIQDQIKHYKKQAPKGGEIIDLSENWVDMSNLPYRKRDQLLNAREILVYENLKEIIGDSPFIVFPKVRLADMLQLTADTRNRQEHAERVKERSVDILVCRLPEMTPVLVVQVEPPAAEGKRKQRGERFLRNALQAAGIHLVSVNPNQLPEPHELQHLLNQEGLQA